jgi:hypothetical protein
VKELEFRPKKVGFLAWECRVKMPGRPNKYYTVRAWTQRGALRKAIKAHANLLKSYTYRSGLSKRGKTITKEIPELPPDAPKRLDTRFPRPGPYTGENPDPVDPIYEEVNTRYLSPIVTKTSLRDETLKHKYDLTTGELIPVEEE